VISSNSKHKISRWITIRWNV